MDGWKSGGSGTVISFFPSGLTLGVECLGLGYLEVLAGVLGGRALLLDETSDEGDDPEHEGGAPRREGLDFDLLVAPFTDVVGGGAVAGAMSGADAGDGAGVGADAEDGVGVGEASEE